MDQEQIDINEFRWYETWLVEEETGISTILIVTDKQAYLDNLGPRLRVKTTESPHPYDMLPIFYNDDINPGLPDIVYNNILKFIDTNKVNLIKFWENPYTYSSCELSQDIIPI